MMHIDPSLQPPDVNIFNEAWITVRNNIFNRDFTVNKLEELRQKYYPKALKARNRKETYLITQEMLDKLGVSHLRIMEPQVYDYDIESETENIKIPDFGLDIEKFPDGFFVREIAEGSSGEFYGVRRGDKVVSINGVKTSFSPFIRASGTGGVFRLRPDFPIKLEVIRADRTLYINMNPTLWNRVSASLASRKVFLYDNYSLCYVHIWHLANYVMVNILKDFLKGNSCDGLLLDLRGFGGALVFLNDFLDIIKKWGKPVVAIIDQETRSIKETISFQLKEMKLATLVGEKTIGSCLASQFFKLSDGSQMIIPVADIRTLTNGKGLEGVGVTPHYNIPIDVRKLNGQDPHLVKAISVLVDELKFKKNPTVLGALSRAFRGTLKT